MFTLIWNFNTFQNKWNKLDTVLANLVYIILKWTLNPVI